MPTALLFALIALLAGGAAFIVILVFFGEKNKVHSILAQLDTAEGVEKQEDEGLMHRLIAADQRSVLERKIQEAAWSKTPRQIIAQCVLFGALGAVMGVALFVLWGSIDFVPVAGFLVFTFAGAYYPIFKLNSAIAARKKAIARELPDFLDIVSTTVEAGIALNGAISVAVDALHGPFGDELRIALSDIRLGRSRTEALAALAKRVHDADVTTTVTAMVQAERLGGNIARVLSDLAFEAREKRLMRAEEMAAQLPVKMTLPMVFFMLPALLLMIFGAALIDFLGPGH